MNVTRLLHLVAVGLGVVASPTLLWGQSSTWELGLRGGVVRHDLLTAEHESDPVVGARLSRYTQGGWGFGVGGEWIPAGDVALADEAGFDADLFRYTFHVDKSLRIAPRTRVTVGAGVGAVTARYSNLPTELGTEDESETNLLIPAAAGVKFMNRAIAPSWGLHFDVRDNIVFLGDEVLGSPRSDDVAHQPEFTAGVSLFFGGKSARLAERAPSVEPGPSMPETVPAYDREAEERARARARIEERIYFDFDRSELKPLSRETLAEKADVLRAYPEVRVLIEGHADERGTVEYNLALGERRARAAQEYLVDLGIDPARLSTVSYGEERPLVDGHNEAAWSQNRRDEFVPEGWVD